MRRFGLFWLLLLCVVFCGSAAVQAASPPETIFLLAADTTATPTVTSLTPASAPASGLSLALTVNGTNFVNGSTVRWNNSPRPTTFGSSTRLTAAIPGSDFATPGAATVTVGQPNGATSNAVTFTVTSETTLIFAQIAEGRSPGAGVNRSVFVILNPNDVAVSAAVEFFISPSGDRFPIDVGIGPLSEFDISISPKSSVVITTAGTRSTAASGWARVKSRDRISGLAIFQFFNLVGGFVTEAGVASSPVARQFLVPAEFKDDFETGLALVNPAESGLANITLRLRQRGQLLGSVTRQLGPRQHAAVFLRELFPGLVTAGFQGTIEIESTELLAATTLRTLRGLQTSTLPIVVIP